MALFVREYGEGSNTAIVLHGGPAAVGDIAPVARELGARWRALEPFQRGSGSSELTVETHVADLDEIVRGSGGVHPVLVGHSWGAMLALAYGARHPRNVAGLVLVGCGTFSRSARTEFERRLEARLTDRDRAEADAIAADDDIDRRYAKRGCLMTRVYGYDLDAMPESSGTIDAAAHRQTWADMMRLQEEGVYPAAFAAIDVPVLMLHGDADPHPGRMTADDLRPWIPQLEYVELERCGHSPWQERHARHAFYDVLHAWLTRQFRSAGGARGATLRR